MGIWTVCDSSCMELLPPPTELVMFSPVSVCLLARLLKRLWMDLNGNTQIVHYEIQNSRLDFGEDAML